MSANGNFLFTSESVSEGHPDKVADGISDSLLDAYLTRHQLPNEWVYFDPAKADEKRECGLHASWGKSAAHGAAVAELGSRRS